ncbi:MAG: cob(I)yrinic acid a,c-diamide adenosyltransferase [Saprospiraceae bacterium]|nr:cob(I)yrinic acid a,c-diamide adenosyltransferase [Saprospiraceae bacterium]MBK9631909.1 cob(I)yrinic acid a,c-diamide adenosyltransferase [Saprospiraceae bacterium]
MKIYTKTGDKGQTALFGGKRVYKDDIRVEAYGCLDELNSHVGMLRALMASGFPDEILAMVQNDLFIMGSHIATDPEKKNLKLPPIREDSIQQLEQGIDQMELTLEPLKNFILPGGSTAIAQAHICRTVCRMTERRVVSLSKEENVEPTIIIYLNRLSDFFFVVSRYIAHQTGVKDILWIPEQ